MLARSAKYGSALRNPFATGAYKIRMTAAAQRNDSHNN